MDHAFTEWGLPGNALPTAVASSRLTARPAKAADADLWWAATEDETLYRCLARRVADAGHQTHDAALDEFLAGLGDWRSSIRTAISAPLGNTVKDSWEANWAV